MQTAVSVLKLQKHYTAKGTHVIIAGRDQIRISEAAEKIKNSDGKGTLETAVLDLDSLEQIKVFAQNITYKHRHLDLLINNAGGVIPPANKTDNGYELQFGVNF